MNTADTARRVLDIDATTHAPGKEVHRHRDELVAAAPDLARALLESQAQVAALTARVEALRAGIADTFVPSTAELVTFRADLARVTAERDRLLNVVCSGPACSAAIVRRDDGSRVCAAGHPARWVNVDLLTKTESELATTQRERDEQRERATRADNARGFAEQLKAAAMKAAWIDRDAARAEAETLRRMVMPFVGDEHGGHHVGHAGAKWYPESHTQTMVDRATATARAAVGELVAVARECRMHAVGYAPEPLVAKLDALIQKHGGTS